MKTNSQIKMVTKHLVENKKITSWEVIELYVATRLSSIIHTLRKRGYVINTIDTIAKNRYGNLSKFATYELIEEPKEVI